MTSLQHTWYFPSLNLPRPIKAFCKYFLLYLTVQVELISWMISSHCTTQRSKPVISTPIYTHFSLAPLGSTRSNILPAGSKHQPSSALDARFPSRKGGEIHVQILWEDYSFSPSSFFSSLFKCQTPTQCLWKPEPLVRSAWKQNKPRCTSPFEELSERQRALQSGDYSAFSSLGLGCRPEIQNISFLYICVESRLISD